MAELCRELGISEQLRDPRWAQTWLRSDLVVFYRDGFTGNRCFEPPHALVEVTVLATAKFAPVSASAYFQLISAVVGILQGNENGPLGVEFFEQPAGRLGLQQRDHAIIRIRRALNLIDVEIPFDVRIGPAVLIAADRKTAEPPAGGLASRFIV